MKPKVKSNRVMFITLGIVFGLYKIKINNSTSFGIMKPQIDNRWLSKIDQDINS